MLYDGHLELKKNTSAPTIHLKKYAHGWHSGAPYTNMD